MTDSTQGAFAPVSAQQQLIPVFAGQLGGLPAQVCDGRALHAFLENGDKFAGWIIDRITKYGFVEDQDFALVSVNPEIKGRGGDRRSKGYHLSLDMAKELAMVENNDRGREARRYFIAMERQAIAAAMTPQPVNPAGTDAGPPIPAQGRTIEFELDDFIDIFDLFKPASSSARRRQHGRVEPRGVPAGFLQTLLHLHPIAEPDCPELYDVRVLDLVETAAAVTAGRRPKDMSPDVASGLLAHLGILVNPPWFILADESPRLALALRGTPWSLGWRDAARALPGAIAQGPTRFAGHRCRGTTLPLAYVLAAGYGEVDVASDLRTEDDDALRAAQAELLRLNPRWDTLRRCVIAGLTEQQTAAALELSATTVHREKQRMRACGMLDKGQIGTALVEAGGAA